MGTSASGINDRGAIVGWYSYGGSATEGFLATHVP